LPFFEKNGKANISRILRERTRSYPNLIFVYLAILAVFLIVRRVVFGFLDVAFSLRVVFAVLVGAGVLHDNGLTCQTPPKK
jgi:uncharacterized membrane protein